MSFRLIKSRTENRFTLFLGLGPYMVQAWRFTNALGLAFRQCLVNQPFSGQKRRFYIHFGGI
ncbi:hypothetical protein GCM10011491_16210 [Brucella endophytica]|uniref:Uncharacterized protein n=1 Tax=Brucella endophytica TaxID=1963359 RepID=A0A916S8I6_9HYPH|nr:hypothetical protein GCM10011491_16210 [Brucella endophytica]